MLEKGIGLLRIRVFIHRVDALLEKGDPIADRSGAEKIYVQHDAVECSDLLNMLFDFLDLKEANLNLFPEFKLCVLGTKILNFHCSLGYSSSAIDEGNLFKDLLVQSA